jgi:predicted enzyme related to lactoylglutathione lyase
MSNRLVMVNVPVEELDLSRRVYEKALGVEFVEDQHDNGPIHLDATFGEWGTPSWFMMSLWPNDETAGTADVGFLVDDVDAAYQAALKAGATDLHGPMDVEGMPRVAEVKDPSGNCIGLYQG